MLERLTETFIAGVELLEAEGRVARDRLVALVGALLVLVACGVAALIGLIAAFVGVTWLLAMAIGVGGALAVVGGVLLAASLLVARMTVLRLRRRGTTVPASAVSPTAVEAGASPGVPEVPPTNDEEADGAAHLPVSTPTSPNHAAPFTTEEALPAALTRNPPP